MRPIHRARPVLAVALAAWILFGCSSSGEPATVAGDAADEAATETTTTQPEPSLLEEELSALAVPVFHATDNPVALSEWGQLAVSDGELVLSDGITPYALNSALFSDYTQKLRTVWLPEGSPPATYDAEESLDFPVGTVITKTFYYPLPEGASATDLRVAKGAAAAETLAEPINLSSVRLVETRILAHRETGWVALPYVWNDEQTEATLSRTGDLVRLTLVDAEENTETQFPYVVPNTNQCSGCHATNHTTKEILPIGPKVRHLNLDVDLGGGLMPQLALWQDLGIVGELPADDEVPKSAAWEDPSIPLNDRARAYLDINCAHCHNKNGPADTSGLFLEYSTQLGPRLGICKPPIAAGTGTGNRRVGIDPGEPDESIFIFRMETADPGAMMPELGRALAHQEGVDLVSEWIESLDGDCG
ncbi:MAG: hypothetical protein HKN94_04585 [Acidimicrobiales bacterium]|nr:hypothetical protein [Acidimicrobiales bacterium]RZV43221.1 MAG: hypothetical protein EX269_13610 [Acidimicrobiales bacterium]